MNEPKNYPYGLVDATHLNPLGLDKETPKTYEATRDYFLGKGEDWKDRSDEWRRVRDRIQEIMDRVGRPGLDGQ